MLLDFSFSKFRKILLPLVCILMIGFVLNSCVNKEKKQATMMSNEEFKKYKAPLEKANRGLIKIDDERIEAFVKRRAWEMEKTGTGMRFQVYEKGNGEKVNEGDVLELNYNISLLDGTQCYSSDSMGVKSFKVGQGGVEAGLEEGVLLLNVGDKARFIILPFMAHSLLGDFDKIPPRTIILYEIEVLRKIQY